MVGLGEGKGRVLGGRGRCGRRDLRSQPQQVGIRGRVERERGMYCYFRGRDHRKVQPFMRLWLIWASGAVLSLASCNAVKDTELERKGPQTEVVSKERQGRDKDMTRKIFKTDDEWKKILSPEQYQIAREKGTEPAFAGKFWDTKTPGAYKCVACGQELFASDNKFDSGSGWPSFDRPANSNSVDTDIDRSHGMERIEVTCSRCGAHLGHVFNDGPKPTGLRYCINSAVLDLEEGEGDEE